MSQTINPSGKEIITVKTDFLGRELSLEVNRVGFRSSASVLVRYGDTVVLGTAMVGRPVSGMDYFPLSIDYEEKFYAAGKMSGSRFIKREGRPSDDAVLIGRLIDRPIRPLWPKGYRCEVQGIATVLSMDPAFRPDMIAMIATSAALMLTGAPFDGPVAGLRVGYNQDGKLEAFLPAEQLDEGALDLVVAANKTGIMMVEAGASEVTEEQIVEALDWAFKAMQPAIALQEQLVKKVGVTAQEYELDLPDQAIQDEVAKYLEDKLGEDLRKPYPERNEMIGVLRQEVLDHFAQVKGEEFDKAVYNDAFDMAVHKDVRKGIIATGTRPDGRKLTEIRPLSSEVGFLPRAHGSSLFTRGVTQAMNIVTLAPTSYAQMVDTMEKNTERRYMHHYNAPGWTVGEVRRLGSPGRREIGHGYLAERALTAVLPTEAEFPYTIRTVTEIMSQNGSTSMAATCSSTLALMDAGVPLKAPVSGIAMGLMIDGDKPYVLSDIADAEDFAGDMDFKVTGTSKGITALQMDMKVHGLPVPILKQALEQGKEGRAHILEHMLTTLEGPRAEMSPYAPRIISLRIPVDKIGEVIGPKGKIINQIQDETGANIAIEDDGTVYVGAETGEAADAAVAQINAIANPHMPERGERFLGTIVKLTNFGAFLSLMPGKDGLLHISKLRPLAGGQRVENVEDVVSVGQKLQVEISDIDDRGKLSLVPVVEETEAE